MGRMKKKTKILACVLAGVMLLVAALCLFGFSRTSGFYSEKQHLSRVRRLAEKRYLCEGSEYTELEIYPLYNENDKLQYALIELKPQGFMYVRINESAFFEWFGVNSMYTRAEEVPHSWMPYRVKEGARESVTDEFGRTYSYSNREFFHDDNGEVIRYFESHFKVAGIENERRYLLSTSSSVYLIPAVKRGEQYLNLVDEAMVDYEPDIDRESIATEFIYFIPKSYFNL